MEQELIELLVLLGGTLVLATFFGTYLARMISYENRPIEKTLALVENRFYRLIGIDVNKQMTWKEYFFALFLTNMVVVIIVVLILVFQNYLPSDTPVEGFSIDLAVNTAISFITDTNLQHYAGDQQLSVISHMTAITFTMFVAPASGIVAAFAFIRSFIRKNFGLGNFYMDFIRVILTLLLPVSFVSALILMNIRIVLKFPSGSVETMRNSTWVKYYNKSNNKIMKLYFNLISFFYLNFFIVHE